MPDGELARRSADVDRDGTVYIMYTSGTTGFPKGVMQRHNVIRNVCDEANRMGVTPNDSTLDYLPLYHAFAVYTALLMSPATGSRHVLMSHFDAGEALRLIEAERITMIHGFDTHYKDLLEHPSRPARNLASLRTGILAAGMLSTEPIARRAQELMPTITGYGMTEIGVGVTGSFLDSDAETRTTMSGWPLVGYEVKIIDPVSGATQPPGQVGEICVRGYQVMQGYYKKPRGDGRDDRRRRLAAHRRQRLGARRRMHALPRPLQGSPQGRGRERRPDGGRRPPARGSAHQSRRCRRPAG